jgi:hypothetical protein
MAVAAIDTYMHRVVLDHATWNPPNALAELGIPFSSLAVLAEQTVKAQQKQKKSRPWVHVKRVLQERLLTETFQSYAAVGKAMSMAGVSQGWTKVARQMRVAPNDIDVRLGVIVHRRNRIVHEGHLRRLERPRTVEHEHVAIADMAADVDWLEGLLNAIDAVLP